MKYILGLLMVLATVRAQAKETLVCALMKNSDKSKYISVKVDLTKPLEEYYQPDDGLDVGKNSYSFVLEVTEKNRKLTLVATFQDTNDEVGQSSWDVDLAKSAKGKSVVSEPITDAESKASMTFVCYHNKN